MRLAMIVARSTNLVIGQGNKLPWYLPEDLKYFKRVTLGKPIIMGRKTFESIGRPLPGRCNIVITRDPDWQVPGVVVASAPDEAIERARNQALIDGAEEALVIGGAQVYRQLLERVDRLYLTEVHAQVEGDAFFPALAEGEWRELAREDHGATEQAPWDYSFRVLERVPQGDEH